MDGQTAHRVSTNSVRTPLEASVHPLRQLSRLVRTVLVGDPVCSRRSLHILAPIVLIYMVIGLQVGDSLFHLQATLSSLLTETRMAHQSWDK